MLYHKKQWLLCCFVFFATLVLWSQKGAKVVTVSTAKQQGFYLQVGVPYIPKSNGSVVDKNIDIRFPWNTLYLYDTFDTASFSVSKGYFGDSVRLNWTLKNNLDLVTSIKISRREKRKEQTSFIEIAKLPADATQYQDKYAQGGVLYEYKVEALGVSPLPKLYNTYITGIGYRNPTATITGKISYKGGNPVEGVTVFAKTSDKKELDNGSALHLENSAYLEIKDIKTPITSATTLQAWIKPDLALVSDLHKAYTIATLQDPTKTIIKKITVELKTDKTPYLEISIDNQIYRLYNYYPSGRINSRSHDVLIPVTDFNNTYTHFSVVLEDKKIPQLYINGRHISAMYVQQAHQNLVGKTSDYTAPYIKAEVPTGVIHLLDQKNGWNTITFSAVKEQIYIDEIRVWNRALPFEIIHRDYKRYLSGSESGLLSYLRLNEGVGQYAYDLSHKGFAYHKNHAQITIQDASLKPSSLWVSGFGSVPNPDQLGVLGVSDSNGNYIISAIPYTGTGTSFTITPVLGQHKFEPNEQLVYLGEGASVVNKVDFTDTSSFVFKGCVLFDTRTVFDSYVQVNGGSFTGLKDGDTYVSGPGIVGYGYNYYQKADKKFAKGEYWLNDNNTPLNTLDDYLERYARIGSSGVAVYIDGKPVLDATNTPVVTDKDGRFSIEVPIGNHRITVKKQGHYFVYDGNFPEKKSDTYSFFEDQQNEVIFIDQTKVTLIGSVVGGSLQGAKDIGFGDKGIYYITKKNPDGTTSKKKITTTNNIGVANITLEYAPKAAKPTPYTRVYIKTNDQTGEYRKKVLPLSYTIDQDNGVVVPTNTSLNFLQANQVLHLNQIKKPSVTTYKDSDKVLATSQPYHYQKKFVYRATPVLRVVKQTTLDSVIVGKNKFSLKAMGTAFYKQFSPYAIELQRFERYINYDTAIAKEFLVPVVDGELVINNNLALKGSESIVVNPKDKSQITYHFRAGLPSINPPFTKSISMKYRMSAVDYMVENYKKEGIVLGGISDGSKTFITAAPDIPDLILRDPPGSNSFASIEKGESISFTAANAFKHTGGISTEFKFLMGVKFAAGGGILGPVIETETTNSLTTGLSIEGSTSNGEDITKTYTFNQTISTSNSTDYVGASGDLYIGNSKNYAYGSYNNLQFNTKNISPDSSISYTNKDGQTLYLSTQKAMYFTEEPTQTFFIYSQKHILEHLIPEYQKIISNIEKGILDPSDKGVLSIEQYKKQIYLWRKAILENERTKHIVKNDRSVYKENLQNTIDKHTLEISKRLDKANDPGSEARLMSQLKESKKLDKLLKSKFEDNISLDAGVGSITRSVQTNTIATSYTDLELTLDQSLALDLGFHVNKAGFVNTTTTTISQDISTSLSEQKDTTTTIAYTIADNDTANVLSLDVVNSFDGNGPVFITLAGTTSCPYEPAQKSFFYNEKTYNANTKSIEVLQDKDREELSNATQSASGPILTVKTADISGVLETNKASFALVLENNGIASADDTFVLSIDNTTNPNNVITNIPSAGVAVKVPVGNKVAYVVTFEKSVSDVYDYKDIRVVLSSSCPSDSNTIFSEVFLSASFIPSCTSVVINKPLNNWVYNKNLAYDVDGKSKPLQISFQGFDTSFANFTKIDLEYRLASSPTWNTLQTYYKDKILYNQELENGNTAVGLLKDTTIIYEWDIIKQDLADASYEIRARSTCANGTTFITDITKGSVDLNGPERFGIPSPSDGILTNAKQLQVQFNEPVFYNSAVSLVEIQSATNQLPLDHQVSIFYNEKEDTTFIEKPMIFSGDIAIEFWLKNLTKTSSAVILSQKDGISISIENDQLVFHLADQKVTAAMIKDTAFHHYTFTYNASTLALAIYRDDVVIGATTVAEKLYFDNNNTLILAGNTFIGNIYDLRLWNTHIPLSVSYANRYKRFSGNEKGLIGYWPMQQGQGGIAIDKSRFKHAIVHATWDIKPKGQAYSFNGDNYLTLDKVALGALTKHTDATISFWIRTPYKKQATIFTNAVLTDKLSPAYPDNNQWEVALDSQGVLTFQSGAKLYPLTTTTIADNQWHHIAILLNRTGSLRTYIDAKEVSSFDVSEIGGFLGSKIWIGARKKSNGDMDTGSYFTGKIDAFRIWNTLRDITQVKRDRFHALNPKTPGLLVYAPMNAPGLKMLNKPPSYFTYSSGKLNTFTALASSKIGSYSIDTPPIKPIRAITKLKVKALINKDQLVLQPQVSHWASLENQVLDITVHRMFDVANNMQQSPITWTALVNKNPVTWYIQAKDKVYEKVIEQNTPTTFDITIINRSTKQETFTISNIPNWLTISQTKGVIPPNSKKTIRVDVNTPISAAMYEADLRLKTSFALDQKQQISLRVLQKSPIWDISPADFLYSMNMVGRLVIDDVFSLDPHDKLIAFHADKVRGIDNMVYDKKYKQYFVYISIYANTTALDKITFKLWDASNARLLEATADKKLTVSFYDNKVLGTKSNPVLFRNTTLEQFDLPLQKGWSWVSFPIKDARFNDLNDLTKSMNLETSDLIKTSAPARLDTYYKDLYTPNNSGWSGTISSTSGIDFNQMYKVRLTKEQKLPLKGVPVSVKDFNVKIKNNWNWLAYPLQKNNTISQALANYSPTEGDVLKSQEAFAIYDPLSGWSGTLTYLEKGKGYMLKSAKQQQFMYPSYLELSAAKTSDEALVNKSMSPSISYAIYQSTMNAVVQLPKGFHSLYIIDKQGEKRSFAKTTDSMNDKNIAFVNIAGNKQESLQFYISNGTDYIASNSLIFTADKVIGTIKKPLVLKLKEDKEFLNNTLVKIHPNPFKHTISVRLSSLEAQPIVFTFYDITSNMVCKQVEYVTPGVQTLSLQPDIAPGVYVLTFFLDQKEYRYKLIKQ